MIGLEPITCWLQISCSANWATSARNHWLQQMNYIHQMDGEGFEPSKASPADLQSVPFGHSGIHPWTNLLYTKKKVFARYFFGFLDILCARACLKKYSRNLHAPLCSIFCSNSVAIARYGALIRAKSSTNCDAHLAESLFQTLASKLLPIKQ